MNTFTEKMIGKAKDIFENIPSPTRYTKLEKLLERNNLSVNEYMAHLLLEVQKMQRKEKENESAESLSDKLSNSKILKITKCSYSGEKSLDVLATFENDSDNVRPVLYRVCFQSSAPYNKYHIGVLGTYTHATVDPTYKAYDKLKSLYEHLLTLI